MKKYMGKLRERNGEFDYIHNHLFETDDNPQDYMRIYAGDFYSGGSEPESDGYYFHNGGVYVFVDSYCEVTDTEYAVLNKYI